ncbi:hypothetical protein [Paraflavitalea speifideaquila]|uniref:hypothetical protein n=1 Tax=Paraflavitalea speifideaquila TaxID=3076558 RepID=UPI0028E4456D|nr:hypothetical protein [Paraflavitalea speifideiaquila]
MKSLIRKMLVGDAEIREYATVTIPGNIQEKVFLEVNGQLINVSQQHWLLCIEPVIFGIWAEKEAHKAAIHHATTCKLYFYGDNKEHHTPAQGSSEAVLRFTRVQHLAETTGTLFLLKQESSQLHQLNALKRYVLFRRYYRKNGLHFRRFQSFVAAYSYPRRIRVISFQQGGYYNIFPMDLLGDMSTGNRYVFGLRHTNIALPKIIETGKLAVAEAPFEQKETIYRLGAHHSSSPPALDTLPFKTIPSKDYGFPIPEWALSYREVRILKTINMGSHMLLWGEPSPEQVLQPPTAHLYLIHFLHYLYQKSKQGVYPLK